MAALNPASVAAKRAREEPSSPARRRTARRQPWQGRQRREEGVLQVDDRRGVSGPPFIQHLVLGSMRRLSSASARTSSSFHVCVPGRVVRLIERVRWDDVKVFHAARVRRVLLSKRSLSLSSLPHVTSWNAHLHSLIQSASRLTSHARAETRRQRSAARWQARSSLRPRGSDVVRNGVKRSA